MIEFLYLVLCVIVLVIFLFVMGLVALCWKQIAAILKDKYMEIRETMCDDFPKATRA